MRYDLHFDLVNPEDQLNRNAIFSLNAVRPTAIAGPQKLANRFLKTLLTSSGSDPLHRKAGTEFSEIIGGNAQDPEDLQTALLLCVQSAVDQIRTIDLRSPWLTASEKLRGADITAFRELSAGRYEVNVLLTTISGERLTVLLPFALE